MCQVNKLLVKGMVCQRCVSIVQKELSNLNIDVVSITLGQIFFQAPLQPQNMESLRQALEAYGFEIIEDMQTTLVRNVKSIVEEMFSDDLELPEVKFSQYISGKLYKGYDLISSSFSSCEGITLEKYVLTKRMEKVKELLVYSEQSISDIAFNLGFSSVAHLSRQFKAMTGLNLTHFRAIRKEKEVLAEQS